MRILITGGAGFIGSHVSDAMVSLGHQVAVLDNLSTGSRENVNRAATFYHADITDVGSVQRIFREFRPEVVVHHAAQTNVRASVDRPLSDAQANVMGSLNLLSAAVANGCRKFVYASSGGAIYGEPESLPVREDHPIRPLSPYGVSKYTVEHYLHVYWLNHGLTYTILRYANVYGPRQKPSGEAGVVAIFGSRLNADQPCFIYGTGEAVRDFVYVQDVVEANVQALSKGDGVAVNIGTGVGTSVNDLYEMLASAVGVGRRPIYAEARTGEVNSIYLDPSLAREALGWEPRVCLAEGLGRTLEWLRQMQ